MIHLHSRTITRGFATLIVLLIASVVSLPAWSFGPLEFHDRLVLIVEEGDTITFLPEGQPPTGSTAPLSGLKIGPVGGWVATLQSGTLIPAIQELFTTGSSATDLFDITIFLPTGDIYDVHTTRFMLSPEPPKFASEFGLPPEAVAVIVVNSDGEITGGSGRFNSASGTTKFFFKVEMPFDLSALPITRGGAFIFEFDD